MGRLLVNSGETLVPFWEKKNKDDGSFSSKNNLKKTLYILKIILYSFSGFMIFWSFCQSLTSWIGSNPEPGHGFEFGYLPGKGSGKVEFELGSWSIAGPGYHAFYTPGVVFGPFLSWFVYPIASIFLDLMNFFHDFRVLKETGLYAICAMLIIMSLMRFITFWPTLRSSLYQEKQLLHQHHLDSIHAKYEKYDPGDRNAKIRKHQEISEYNKKHNLRPFVVFENFFINTPIFLIVFKIVTISRPLKFVNLFGIWDLAKTPWYMVRNHLTEDGWKYLLICMIIIPFNFFSQRVGSILSKVRNPQLKKIAIDKNSQSYKMQRIQKIMTFMFLCFTFAWSISLAIYYFFNSIFTIIQNLIIHFVLIKRKSNKKDVEIKLRKLGINA